MTFNDQITAPIFNIQSFSIHDGPGIRTTIFLKGCPLQCVWCQNPESHNIHPELMFYSHKCVGCNSCVTVCPSHANTLQVASKCVSLNRSLCIHCGKCINTCQKGTRELSGSHLSVAAVLQRVLDEKLFLQESGGGLTISGGEALLHPDFTYSLCHFAQSQGIHTAIETSGYATKKVVNQVFSKVNLALYDIKHMDSAIHKRLTGVPNEIILDNVQYIYKTLKVPVIIRVPIVPGYNASLDNIEAIAQFVSSHLSHEVEINLLPYHNLGESKNQSLGIAQLHTIETPSSNLMKNLVDVVSAYGLSVKIGG